MEIGLALGLWAAFFTLMAVPLPIFKPLIVVAIAVAVVDGHLLDHALSKQLNRWRFRVPILVVLFLGHAWIFSDSIAAQAHKEYPYFDWSPDAFYLAAMLTGLLVSFLTARTIDRARTAEVNAKFVAHHEGFVERARKNQAARAHSRADLTGAIKTEEREGPSLELLFKRKDQMYDEEVNGAHFYRVGVRPLDDRSSAAFVVIENTVPRRQDIRLGAQLLVLPPGSATPGPVPTSFATVFRSTFKNGTGEVDETWIDYKDGVSERVEDDGSAFELHLRVIPNAPHLRVGVANTLVLFCAFSANGLIVSEDPAIMKIAANADFGSG